MPKVSDTRKDKAEKLLERLERGPSFYGVPMLDSPLTPEEAERQYRRWVESWILDDLTRLVPELKNHRKD